jgi:hypothetical protein
MLFKLLERMIMNDDLVTYKEALVATLNTIPLYTRHICSV